MDREPEAGEPELDKARSALFVGLETSRVLVRRSKVLIELSESDGPPLPADRDLAED